MKLLRAKAQVKAFTLIELLVVIALVVMLWMMIMPERPSKSPSLSTRCMNNQKQINIGFHIWAGDNEDKFSWQVSTNEEGTKELILNNQAVSQYQSLSTILSDPHIFWCLSDRDRMAAERPATMDNSNISYFMNVSTTFTDGPAAILTGDRHLQVADNPVKPGLFVYSNDMVMGWTRELHATSTTGPAGALSFVDGHVERTVVKTHELTDVFNRQNVGSERLLVP